MAFAQSVQVVQALPVLVEPRPQLRVRPRVVPASSMVHDHLSRVPKWRPPSCHNGGAIIVAVGGRMN